MFAQVSQAVDSGLVVFVSQSEKGEIVIAVVGQCVNGAWHSWLAIGCHSSRISLNSCLTSTIRLANSCRTVVHWLCLKSRIALGSGDCKEREWTQERSGRKSVL